jgi:hypothetical protein
MPRIPVLGIEERIFLTGEEGKAGCASRTL